MRVRIGLFIGISEETERKALKLWVPNRNIAASCMADRFKWPLRTAQQRSRSKTGSSDWWEQPVTTRYKYVLDRAEKRAWKELGTRWTPVMWIGSGLRCRFRAARRTSSENGGFMFVLSMSMWAVLQRACTPESVRLEMTNLMGAAGRSFSAAFSR